MGTRIGIIGLGLIGGSLAKAWQDHPDVEVVAIDREEETIQQALKDGTIVAGSTEMEEELLVSCDVILLCVPVGQVIPMVKQLCQLPLQSGTIITDTGSTKCGVMEGVSEFIQEHLHFIGGHPMAGSHRSGYCAASPSLLANAFYVITPFPTTPKAAVERLVNLLRITKVNVIEMEWQVHDQVVGAVSHYPHVLAAAMVNMVARYNKDEPLYHLLAAGGYKDFTRIAASNWEMWRDIVLNNRHVLLTYMDELRKDLDRLAQAIRHDESDYIEHFFQAAKEARQSLPERKRGGLLTWYDCYVDVPDHPGVIAEITVLLANGGFNLRNITILENRDGVLGALCLTFRQKEEMEGAMALLEEHGYPVSLPSYTLV